MKAECGCVYATDKNTESVRKGYEMGGYVKEFCPTHAKDDGECEDQGCPAHYAGNQSIPGDNPGLDERVYQFHCMSLPGQPMMMHMGTSRLVNDLHLELNMLRLKYNDLIMQVETVHQGESRHETARRYIRNAEQQDNPPEAQANES